MGAWETDADNIRDALAKWTPPLESTGEAQFEDALYAYLNKYFPDEVVHRQYSRGKTRADLYVEFKGGAKVAVELKRNLVDRGEYHRLIGQTYEYLREWKVEVVVVICGESDPSLVKLAREAVTFLGNVVGLKQHLVEKPAAKAANASG